jgi:hypothetical protein
MTQPLDTQAHSANSILDFSDLIATAIVIGVLLFIFGTPASWGATSPPDSKAGHSIVTDSRPLERHERSKAELMDKDLTKLDLGKDPMDMRLRDKRSENQIRADETTTHLLAPWH